MYFKKSGLEMDSDKEKINFNKHRFCFGY